VTIGTNEMVGTDPNYIISYVQKMVKKEWKKGNIPELWDGNTAKRIVNILVNL
jgi:UDP-N-acetylglucosamine 2-epimerase (non-hydrolysing)